MAKRTHHSCKAKNKRTGRKHRYVRGKCRTLRAIRKLRSRRKR